MSMKQFIRNMDQEAVAAAIRAAEQATSAEIRVCIGRHKPEDVMQAARAAFLRLGMTATRERNGVLIYVAPRARRFAVLGDQGIHEHVGEQHWQEIAAAMGSHFGKGDFTAGITHAIRTAAAALARHFPRQKADRNELPDHIATD